MTLVGSLPQAQDFYAGHASEAELEEIVACLRDGNVDIRSAAAERLFNKATVDEAARLRITSLNVVQPLVLILSIQQHCLLRLLLWLTRPAKAVYSGL